VRSRHPSGSLAAAAAILLLLFCGLMCPTGCGTSNPNPSGTFARGLYFTEHGKNQEAVTAMEDFLRRNPTDSLAARAQYLKALSYMKMKEYPLAAVEMKILCKDYPSSELVENASFQEGLAYFLEVGRVERDLSGAYQARTHFQKFLLNYPDSQHVPEVRDILRKISDMIVRKRLGAAEVYLHLGQPAAAGQVLDSLLAEESQSGLLDRVLLLRGKSARKAGQREAAVAAYRRLIEDYPNSPLVSEAQSALADLADADES
jgi:outer membrane protein assembly factor BamD